MSTPKFVRILIAAALFALPVAAISAQSGASSGYVWDGASDWPGVTQIIVAPSVLPETGSNKVPEPAIKNWRFDGFTLVPDFGDVGEPATMPETGQSDDIYIPPNLPAPGETELTIGELEAAQTPGELPVTGNTEGIYVPPNLPAPGETELTIGELAVSSLSETEPGDVYWASASPAPSALPETGYDRSSALREAYAQLRHDGSVEPVSLPETGFDWDRALRDAYAQLRHDGSVEPAALPQTGASSMRPPFFGALPPYLVSEESFDAYTELLARGSRSESEPSILPVTGRSGGSIDVPSDPPLVGGVAAGANAAQVAVGDPSDPPLLTGSEPTALPATGSAAQSLLNGAYNEEFTWPGDLAVLP